MHLNDILPYLIAIASFWSGFYLLFKIRFLRNDKLLKLNFMVLGVTILYVGGVYTVFFVGMLSLTDLPVLLRPINFLLILIPGLIAWRMSRE